jgi:Domain of unknown function DUF29
MSDLYDTDIALWSEHQADLLRRRAAGQLVNDADLDWPNIAEEIAGVNANLESSLESRIGAIIEHLMRLQVSPAVDPRRRLGLRFSTRWTSAARGRPCRHAAATKCVTLPDSPAFDETPASWQGDGA